MKKRSRPSESVGRYLTTRQSAARLGVTVNAIKSWIRDDELPALRTPGGHHRIAEADLLEFQSRLSERSKSPVRTRSRVLIVDDDRELLSVLKEALSRALPDVTFQVASDGYEALVQVGSFRPDVLVLDIRMPRLDGFEVCTRLKSRKETAGIRILAMTGFPDDTVRQRILDCGADDFLVKPFPIEVCRAQVVALLSKARAGR